MLSTKDLIEDEGLRAEGLIVDVDHPERGRYTTVGCPFTLSDSPVEVKRSPLLGEHNAEILTELLELSRGRARASSPRPARSSRRAPIHETRTRRHAIDDDGGH